MRAHTITTKARVGTSGRPKRTIVPGGILALSLAVVLLAATASTASAARELEVETPWLPSWASPTSPNGYGFGDRQVGTTSPAQGYSLIVRCSLVAICNDTFSPKISVSGDYAQTNDCPPTMSSTGVRSQSCTINVTFTPTNTGPKNGTLSTGPGGPTATLTGNGVTTRTPPVLPLRLFVYGDRYLDYPKGKIRHELPFTAGTNNDSTLVATGSEIEKTTKQLVAGEQSKIKARLKHPNKIKARLKHPNAKHGRPTVKLRVAATDEFGQTATDKFKVRLCLWRDLCGL